MSVPWRISVPPATAKPSTAAMMGFSGRLWRRSACQWMSGTSDMSCMLSSSVSGAHRLETGAGTEDVAAPGEDRDAQPRIVVEHPPGAIHPGQHAGAERVLRFGAVERDGQYVAVAVEQAVIAIHAGSSVVHRMSKSSAGSGRDAARMQRLRVTGIAWRCARRRP